MDAHTNGVDLDTLIYGADPLTGLVAADVAGDEVVLYRRTAREVEVMREPLQPWLAADQRLDLPGAEWTQLEGEGFRHLAEFARWSDYLEAMERLQPANTAFFSYSDPLRQYLVRSGRTLFKGMTLAELRRLQLDLETATLSPHHPEARIILIALGDETGAEILEGEERDLLLRLNEEIRRRDPEVIEGHNIFGFDLPYLAVRAERHGIALNWGRDGSAIQVRRPRRAAIGGRTRPVTPVVIRGRHVIDTMIGVQRFDAASAELESYGLKEVCLQLGLSEPNRVLVNQAEMAREWAERPELVREYARQDVIETRRLAEHVMATDFYLTQMVPEPYQSVALSGTGEKINALLVREYLRRGCALPRPQDPRSFAGGYVEVRRVGVIAPVVKVDVESLYPSIMLTDGIAPASDTQGIFLPMLGELTRRRLEAKARAKLETGAARGRWHGLQSSLKVLINSFYGYLGASGPSFLFNDFGAAERVTERGRQLIQHIADRIEQTGGAVIEIDTDGVYFRPPRDVSTEERELAFVEELADSLPAGIRLQHDGRYRAMVSLKQKNYACVGYDGRTVLRGASLRSRAEEAFGRSFLGEAVQLLVAGELTALSGRYQETMAAILAGALPVGELARKERVTEKTHSSPAKKRAAAVAGDTAVGDYLTVYQRADGSLARVEDYAGDEDRAYYAEKLYKFALRLAEAIGSDFDRLFPRPSRQRARQQSAGQVSLTFD